MRRMSMNVRRTGEGAAGGGAGAGRSRESGAAANMGARVMAAAGRCTPYCRPGLIPATHHDFLPPCLNPLNETPSPSTPYTRQELYTQFGLDVMTIDFIGHAIALHQDDSYMAAPAGPTVSKVRGAGAARLGWLLLQKGASLHPGNTTLTRRLNGGMHCITCDVHAFMRVVAVWA